MEIKKLLDSLASPRQEALNRHLELTVQTLAMQLMGAPAGEKIKEEFIVSHYLEHGFKNIFGGKGPKARKIEEQMRILEYAFAETPDLATPVKRLKQLHQKFNLHLITEPAMVKAVKDQLDIAAHLIHMRDAYPTRLPSLQDEYNGSAVNAHSDLYRDASGEAVLILRAKVSGSDVDVMVVGQRRGAVLYLHHPLEDTWVPAEADSTLFGLEETIKAEIDKVTARMGLNPPPDYSFTAEIDKVKAELKPLFESDAFDGLNPMHFKRESPVSSRLMIPTQFGHLVFWHTKGDYPMLRWSFVHDLEHMRSIQQEQYPNLVWKYAEREIHRTLKSLVRAASLPRQTKGR